MREPGEIRIEVEACDSPAATAMIAGVQREYVLRYGGEDRAPVDPAEFAPPRGLFLVAYLDGEPVGCGGWRTSAESSADPAAAVRPNAEIKRIYVASPARRRGLARQLLARLEETAAAAGHRRMILETGLMQPEAIALYASAGYERIPPFGFYRNSPNARHYAKWLAHTECREGVGRFGSDQLDERAG